MGTTALFLHEDLIQMCTVPGLDRLDGSLIESMPDDLWSLHTTEIQTLFSAQTALGFTEFCAQFADGTMCTKAMETYMASKGGSGGPTKNQWPEFVGKSGADAVSAIRDERKDLSTVETLPDGAMVTMDFREDRVRIFVKADGTVAHPPCVG